eukprot:1056524-Rhodomonas_salina.1
MDVKPRQCDGIILRGIRAAITEARQVCVAHKELAKTAPKAFGPHARHQYTARGSRKRTLLVPPKPARRGPPVAERSGMGDYYCRVRMRAAQGTVGASGTPSDRRRVALRPPPPRWTGQTT